MELITRYSTFEVFTLGELRALVGQTEPLPDDVTVNLWGKSAEDPEDGSDVIELVWDQA